MDFYPRLEHFYALNLHLLFNQDSATVWKVIDAAS